MTNLKLLLIFLLLLTIVGCSPFISYMGNDGKIEYSTKKFDTSAEDKRAWKKATDANSISSYVTYLHQFPSGEFAGEANEILDFIETKFKVKISRDISNIKFESEDSNSQTERIIAKKKYGNEKSFPDIFSENSLESIRMDYSKVDLAFFYENIPSDTDADGIFDSFDNCPNSRSNIPVDAFGCEIKKDEDGDGIPDDKDECPTKFGIAINNGCPEETKENTFDFRGKVVDENGDGIIGATIFVEGTTIGTSTDLDGNFILSNLPEGTYNLKLNNTGYNDNSFQIDVGFGNNSKVFRISENKQGSGSSSKVTESELWNKFQEYKNNDPSLAEQFAKQYQNTFQEGPNIQAINDFLYSRINNQSTGDTITTISKQNKYITRSYDCGANLNGRVGFSQLPDSMIVNNAFTFKVFLDDSSQVKKMIQTIIDENDLKINVNDVKFKGRDTIENFIFRDIKVAEFVSVELFPSPNNDFDLQPFHKNEKQKINCEFTPRWEWEITPKSIGEKKIKLVIQSYNGTETNLIMSKELLFTVGQEFKVIEPVASHPPTKPTESSPSFLQQPIAWFGIIGLLGTGIFAFLFFRKRNKNQGEQAPNTQSTTQKPAHTILPVLPQTGTKKKKVFLSYAHEDEEWKDKLDNHLSALKHTEQIETWNDREIIAGEKWDAAIEAELTAADIILFLISSDFLASEYIFEEELPIALKRHNDKEAVVVPIFVRACDFRGLPFAELQGFPIDAKPIASFDAHLQDEALMQVASGIRAIVEGGNVEAV